MRRTIAAAASGGLAAAALLGTGPAASAETDAGNDEPVVVVDHLDNPRQLNWHGSPGDHLVIAEAGSGGGTCFGEGEAQQCAGLTGAVSVVDRPHEASGTAPERALEGLLSIAGPDGSFAVGSNGADAAAGGEGYLVSETSVPAEALPPGAADLPGVDQLGHLLFGGEGGVELRADLAGAEAEHNPDLAQIESNPYAVLWLDEESGGPAALVADAAANTVWKVSAPEGEDGEDQPAHEVSVFATWPTPAGDDETPEFVPTSLAQDDAGNVYVGGLGSGQAGRGAVEQYSADGELVTAWNGFTSVTGIAVEPDGSHLYVSQLFGTVPLLPPGDVPEDEAPPAEGPMGDVVRVDVEAGTYTTEPVPYPAGLAVDEDGRVYVSANSLSDADGSAGGPGAAPGQVWRFSFDDAEEAALPVTGTPWPPEDTGGQFVAMPADFVVSTTVHEACGTTVFLRTGDVREAEWRVTRSEEETLVEYRGGFSLDAVTADGRIADELDASGEAWERTTADGAVEFSFDGPAVFYTAPEEEEAYAAAGLPTLFTFTEGTLTETISAGGEVTLTSVPEEVTDVCDLLVPRPAS